MPREEANSIEKGRETIEFFLNWDAVSDMSGKRPDEAIGYRIMLMSDDISLKIAILLEGACIDYMFKDPPSGTRQSFRASIDGAAKAKNFIRVQTEVKQQHIVKFYLRVLNAMLEYHVMIESYGICWCCITDRAKRKLREEVLNAYYDLYAVLYEPTLKSFSSSSV